MLRTDDDVTPRGSRIGAAGLGALLGGLVGGFLVVGVTVALKAVLDWVSARSTFLLVAIPFIGLSLAALLLHKVGKFPRDTVPADITGDVMDTAGEEERFPWRLAPIRALAIFATVGSGGAMGTEAPAAYLGVAAGAWFGDRGRWLRPLLRP